MNDVEALLAAYHKAATALSYFNAAEGRSWGEEASGRGVAESEYRAAVEALKAAGIEPPRAGYLVPSW